MNSRPMSTTGHHWYEAERRRTTAAQVGATVIGWTFLLLGVAGFVPALTPGFSSITFAGTDSGAELFGVFAVSILGNLVHLAAGVLGLVMSWMVTASRRYLLVGGVLFALLGLYGILADAIGDGGFLPSNVWTGVLHLALGVLMIVLAAVLSTKLPRESEARGEGDFGETGRGAAR
ncbi:DUF4383 domain-containing protein [Glycomyces harbinensis]|uniref:DUF4383 domain-containing protein n=1 Tax=Glycomyces harbinensis TaxID=58114 RepID=A0A1G6SQI7_9ACTN|nr:DUF4383 domain-containing protein [Glycomyces harbinensis]SDD18425.1 protein of unknown function [Glycomyces harbinensis]